MKTTLTLLTVATALVLPVAASAQSTDVTYCKKLATVWRAYNEGADPAVGIATALSTCNGSPGSAIPVLEKALSDEGFKLPKK